MGDWIWIASKMWGFPFLDDLRGSCHVRLPRSHLTNWWGPGFLGILFVCSNPQSLWWGAIWSWGYLKSLHNRELRSYPQVSKHILANFGQYHHLITVDKIFLLSQKNKAILTFFNTHPCILIFFRIIHDSWFVNCFL